MKGTTPELDRYYQRKQNLLSLLIEIHERMYPMMKYCERLQPVMMGINDQTTVDLTEEDLKWEETRLFRLLDPEFEHDKIFDDQTTRSILKDLRKVIKGLEEELELCD